MNSIFIFPVVSGSRLRRYLWKLDRKAQSEHVAIKEISKPPSFHFCFAHLGGIIYLQYFTAVGGESPDLLGYGPVLPNSGMEYEETSV